MSKNKPTRRGFLKTTVCTGIGVTVPYFFSPQLATAQATGSLNDRLKIGLVGAGGMGKGNADAARKWCDVVAIADVDSGRAAEANKKLSTGKADTYGDYRKVLERNDLDALLIATPDHWHTKVLIEGLKAGHDIYCEKPLTLTIDEGKLVRKAAKESGQIVQVGTQQRSDFRPVCQSDCNGRRRSTRSYPPSASGHWRCPHQPDYTYRTAASGTRLGPVAWTRAVYGLSLESGQAGIRTRHLLHQLPL